LSGDVPVPGATTQVIDSTYEFHNNGVTANYGNINADSLSIIPNKTITLQIPASTDRAERVMALSRIAQGVEQRG
jgi:hypothetical protein